MFASVGFSISDSVEDSSLEFLIAEVSAAGVLEFGPKAIPWIISQLGLNPFLRVFLIFAASGVPGFDTFSLGAII